MSQIFSAWRSIKEDKLMVAILSGSAPHITKAWNNMENTLTVENIAVIHTQTCTQTIVEDIKQMCIIMKLLGGHKKSVICQWIQTVSASGRQLSQMPKGLKNRPQYRTACFFWVFYSHSHDVNDLKNLTGYEIGTDFYF